ncbi:flagellar basal body-associated FliL family protein [Geosporobacter ferrireducens]|uniref:Flagellar protein FliL n=1 Tax=Geosporobacter ferrireducens TaxID=1424294 RepID=A0A1D8GBJ4_9FIRM|nr:flagellar basal body-associated FliL family protein [Geosporobacter ferrireducens]AOT68272.1 hypothetical protein Gferi_00920 [Geosporobacter ferrireducens]MTI57306.1 hypothetical protein [Geosporobacter ferrireducens]
MSVKKVVLFSIIGFIVTAAVFGGAFYLAANRNSEKAVKEIKTYNYSVGELYCNIKDSRKILKVNINFEITDERLSAKLDEKKPKIRNDILELIRSKEETVLVGDKGQQMLRNEILKSVKQMMDTEKITNVYFVEFIIQ